MKAQCLDEFGNRLSHGRFAAPFPDILFIDAPHGPFLSFAMLTLTQLITQTFVTASVLAKEERLSVAAADSYAALTDRVTQYDPPIDLSRIQTQPDSVRGRDYLEEDLDAANAAQDPELLAALLTLLGALQNEPIGAPGATGVDLDNVLAGALNIWDVVGEDLAVRIHNSRFLGEVHIGKVRAGSAEPAASASQRYNLTGNRVQTQHTGDVYQNVSSLDLSALERAYLEKLYADCNELLLANDGLIDHPHRRQPRMQHVYVDLSTQSLPTQDLLIWRLAALNITHDEFKNKLQEFSLPNAVSDRLRETDDLELLRNLNAKVTEIVAASLNATADALWNVFANITVLEAIRAHPQLLILGNPGGGKSTLTRRLAGVLASICRKDLDAPVSRCA